MQTLTVTSHFEPLVERDDGYSLDGIAVKDGDNLELQRRDLRIAETASGASEYEWSAVDGPGERVIFERRWIGGDVVDVVSRDVGGYLFSRPLDDEMRFRWPVRR